MKLFVLLFMCISLSSCGEVGRTLDPEVKRTSHENGPTGSSDVNTYLYEDDIVIENEDSSLAPNTLVDLYYDDATVASNHIGQYISDTDGVVSVSLDIPTAVDVIEVAYTGNHGQIIKLVQASLHRNNGNNGNNGNNCNRGNNGNNGKSCTN